MLQLVSVETERQQEDFCILNGIARLTPGIANRQHPDGSWFLVDGTAIAGRFSVWWKNPPPYENQRVGLIGHYSAANALVGSRILQVACDHLAAQGCAIAIGPMDWNSWQDYRLVTERGTEPPFFLEPDHPDDWPCHFTDNGFKPIAHYFSALNSHLGQIDPGVAEIAARLQEEGFCLRALNIDRFQSELALIHDLTLEAFQDNLFFTPISRNDFLAQYLPSQGFVRPDLVLIAEQAGRPAGFIFAVPDLLQARRGQAVNTIIIKTLAVERDLRKTGLGRWLAVRCHEVARQLGYTRAIHALMHETNRSRKISSYSAEPIRRYTLYGRSLA